MTQISSAALAIQQPSGVRAKLHDPAIRGAMWKILSCLSFSGVNGIVHYFSCSRTAGHVGIPAAELAFFETVFGFLLILPWLYASKATLKTTQFKRYAYRAIAAALGIFLWFTALSEMPIVQVVAFKYTGPFFTILGARLFLGESVGLSRALSIILSLVGALTITVMGHDLLNGDLDFASVGFLALMPLGATACYASSAIFGKKLAKVDSPQTICFYLMLMTMPLLFIFANVGSFVPEAWGWPQWVTPEAWHWPWIVAMGAFLAFAYYALSNAYVIADLTYLLPLSFVRLVAGAIIGMIFFAEYPTVWTWIGSTLILIASVTLCKGEIQRKKLKKARKKARKALDKAIDQSCCA